MLKAMLGLNGYDVTTKKDIIDLEAFIDQHLPDIILMDMLLSGDDGRDVCQKLKSKKEYSAIPIIMLSAHPEAKSLCIDAGANYFLSKPFEIDELYEIVQKAAEII